MTDAEYDVDLYRVVYTILKKVFYNKIFTHTYF